MFEVDPTQPPAGAQPQPADTSRAPAPIRFVESDHKSAVFGAPDDEVGATPEERLRGRHRTLIDCLDFEVEKQAEERQQMQIDDDYYHHRQWRTDDAQVLMDRGQSPAVYNQARQTIDWLSGTEKRTSKDYKVVPRRKEDSDIAEVKTDLLKYIDDVNNARHHRSMAFKSMVLSGIGWLEESINDDPDRELVLGSSEDWRNVYRDSRDMSWDQSKSRYLFRRKKIDLDYACALLPGKKDVLIREAQGASAHLSGGRENEIWFLGENLTNAAEQDWKMGAAMFGERASFIGSEGGYVDDGRMRSVDLIEAWYRVPETVTVMQGGKFHRKQFDPSNPEHVAEKAKNTFTPYNRVRMTMRVMICTYNEPLWDGPSIFKHNRFQLIPMWGYRRGADGMAYGVMRGMRDPQDSLNKKMSKANWLMSSNRVVMDEGAVDDIETLREEAARPDGIIVKRGGDQKRLEFIKSSADFTMAMNMVDHDISMIRDAGGVTNENLGRDTNAASGKAIGLKQNQGALQTFELFDNYLLCMQQAGMIRLSNVEQFYSEEKVIRIAARGGRPPRWLPINAWSEADGKYVNDIVASEADFVVDSQDYRATLQQAAMEQLFELMGKIAAVAPQIVVNILDIMVDSMDVANKDEIVERIRKANGQRDGTKEPTPEEAQADQAAQAEQQEAKQLQKEMAVAQLAEVKAKVKSMDLATSKTFLDALLVAMEAANIAVTVPGVVPAADSLAETAGLGNGETGVAPEQPTAVAQPAAAPQQAIPQGQPAPAGI